ncbi:Very-long-chain 3-oxoacyl-CoA reductase 1 [Borealophlyctis nickersoniae]|nr:Very-long-chain 3-oxoacyl-CoA reductase 1 [Borealophlyctis nickersoniae]
MLSITTFIYLVGLFTAARSLVSFAFWIKATFFPPQDSLAPYRRANGAYALVTGPTGEIGLNLALELARRGFNLALVGRNATKLDDVKVNIAKKYPAVRITTIISDAQDASDENFARITDAVKALDGYLTILVNNVGCMNNLYAHLHETPAEDIKAIVNVNCLYTTLLTRTLLPILISCAKTNDPTLHRCLILNVGSASSYLPIHSMSAYSSSKHYINGLSNNLRVEYSPRNIDVCVINPGFVQSDMCRLPNAAPAAAVARAAVDKVGLEECSPYWEHAVTFGAARVLGPRIVGKPLSGLVADAGKVHNEAVLKARKGL